MKYYFFWLSLVCVGMFILQSVIPGFTGALILNNSSWTQPWRFVTSIFLHASLEHILFNLFALLLFGIILEKVIGSKWFLVVFFCSGVIANLIAVNFYSSALGASGAIFGVLGCLAFLRPKMIVWTYGFPMPMVIAAVVWVLASLLGIFMPSTTGDIAHLSGIVVGFGFGVYLRNKFKEEKKINLDVPDNLLERWEDVYLGR